LEKQQKEENSSATLGGHQLHWQQVGSSCVWAKCKAKIANLAQSKGKTKATTALNSTQVIN